MRLYERRGDKVDLNPYREIKNMLVESGDRFAVAFVDGGRDGASGRRRASRPIESNEDPATPAEALYKTVTHHLGHDDTTWSVFDRQTGEMHEISLADMRAAVGLADRRQVLVARLSERSESDPDDIQFAVDDMIYDHLGTSRSASEINNSGFGGQIDALVEAIGIDEVERLVNEVLERGE